MSKKSTLKTMAGLIVLVRPMLHFMLLAVLLGIAGFICAILIPVSGCAAALAAAGFDMGVSISAVSVCLIAFALMRGLLRYGEQACNHYIAFRILAVIRDKVFAALRRLCPAKLDGRDKGDLISLITSDVELLEVFYAHTISPVMIAFAVSATMTVFIARISPVAGVIAAAAYIVVGAVIPVRNGGKTRGCGSEYRNAAGELNSLFLDSLNGLSELIQFKKTDQKRKEIDDETERLGKIHKALKRCETISESVTDIAVFSFNIIMLISQLYLYASGKISFPAAVICTAALMSSYGPVTALSNLSNSLAQTLASGDRVLSLLREEPVTKDITDGKDILADSVSCRDVTYSYGGEKVLDGVSAEAEARHITGIYGKSGCGKSTLLKLIMRFRDRDGGMIALSGTDVARINTACLRSNQSCCTQETFIFDGTIADNIRIAKQNASDDEVMRAASAASLDEFIASLPQGLDTPAGELGSRLSGGEKQRIGLARAFISGAPIMLLDEPTSNLDSLNEAAILKALRGAKDKTILLVSHRRSTLAAADKIYSLDSKERHS